MSGTYVSFELLPAYQQILAQYVKSIGLYKIKHPFHITTVYSHTPIDYKPLVGEYREISTQGFMFFNTLHGLALAIQVQGKILDLSHQQSIDQGGTWNFKNFVPHITLAYGLQDRLNGLYLDQPNFKFLVGPECVRTVSDTGKVLW